jgi:hypothetical protein
MTKTLNHLATRAIEWQGRMAPHRKVEENYGEGDPVHAGARLLQELDDDDPRQQEEYAER